MLKKMYIFTLLIFLTACSQNVTEEDFLIGGTWVATAGYEDEEARGEPNCYPFEEGIEFTSDDSFYNATSDHDFEYWLYEHEGDSNIFFAGPTPGYGYRITKISEDEI